MVYTDHQALITTLASEARGRIASWQVRLGEYNLRYIHISERENILAYGVSQVPIRTLESPARPGKAESYVDECLALEKSRGPNSRLAKGVNQQVFI